LGFVKTALGLWRAKSSRALGLTLIGWLENKPFVVVNFVSFQKTDVFLAKGCFGVVLLLLLNVATRGVNGS